MHSRTGSKRVEEFIEDADVNYFLEASSEHKIIDREYNKKEEVE